MHLLSHLNRSIHRWHESRLTTGSPAREAGAQAGVVLTVALISMAAASILVMGA